MPPPNRMVRKYETTAGGKVYIVVVDSRGVVVREAGKKQRFHSSWKDVAEFVMQQQFFTFTK